MDVLKIKSYLNAIPDFPKPGILFQDIFPLFHDPAAVEMLITNFVSHLNANMNDKIDVVVGLDARGFLIGPLIAMRLGCAFAPVRKQGKLPGPCVSVGYEKEYGTDYFEMQVGAIKKDARVIIVDDLLATGGSAKAAQQLIQKLGGLVAYNLFIVELTALSGASLLSAPVHSIVKVDD